MTNTSYDSKSNGVTPNKCQRRPGCPDPSPPIRINTTGLSDMKNQGK